MAFIGLLFVIAFFVILVGSIMGFVANSRITRLNVQILALTRQIKLLTSGDAAEVSNPAAMKPAALKTPVVSKTQPRPAKTAITKAAPKPVPANPALPKKPKRSFEEELGARWAVWVGGIALLFGAVFLLRYTIEAGFFTPGMRVAMAGLLGAVLLGGGEWQRRADILPRKPTDIKARKRPALMENSYIPGVLTAVGIFTLLGAVFAAYELYGFIGPIPAFALMALISLGALCLGLLHGPWISALGLAASFATPLLIQTETPNVYALFGYLSIISLAAWRLAAFRKWGWLDLAAFAGGAFWLIFAISAAEHTPQFWVWLGFFALVMVASTFIAAKPNQKAFMLGELPILHTAITAAALSLILGLTLLIALAISPNAFAVNAVITAAFVLGLTASAFYNRPLLGLLGVAAFIAAAYFRLTIPYSGADTGVYIIAPVFALIIGGGLFQLLRNSANSFGKFWPYLAAFFPPIILWIAENKADVSDYATPALAFGLAGLLMVAAHQLRKVRSDQVHRFSPYPWAAAFAYWLGVVTLTSGLTESMGLITGVVIAAALYSRLKWESLRWIALGFAGIAIAQILFIEVIKPDAIAPALIFNHLWLFLAVPAFICFAAGWHLQKDKTDLPSEALKGLGLALTALFFVYQIRHAMNGGEITSHELSFDEIALQVLTGLCFTLGGVALNIPSAKFDIRSKTSRDGIEQLIPALLTLISYVTLAALAIGLCLIWAPLLNDNVVIKGGVIFNTLILAYLLPAILLGLIMWLGRGKRPDHYIKLAAGLMSAGALFYVTSQIRRFYSGAQISLFDKFPQGFETYTISASWLIAGIALLFIGLKAKSKSLRLGSAFIITLTVLKAFLIDMATLEGVLRAMSFVILGLVLIVIGRVYQKILFKDVEKNHASI